VFGTITNEALTIYAVGVTAFAVVTNTIWAKSSEGVLSAGAMVLGSSAMCLIILCVSLGTAVLIRIVERSGWL
jgi:hypothetical protein